MGNKAAQLRKKLWTSTLTKSECSRKQTGMAGSRQLAWTFACESVRVTKSFEELTTGETCPGAVFGPKTDISLQLLDITPSMGV